MGKIVSVESAVVFGRLNYRAFQRQLLDELKFGRSFRWVKLRDAARRDLLWWSRRENLSKWVAVRPPRPEILVHTDAFTQGWGASGDDWVLSGVWSLQEAKEHINSLEMRAVG